LHATRSRSWPMSPCLYSAMKNPPQQSKGVEINGARVTQGLIFARFGYVVWDKEEVGWGGQFFDDDGELLARCSLVARNLACEGTK
jgi:hypothetical protein